jgi:uncharacterized protein (TIRG00374 family)
MRRLFKLSNLLWLLLIPIVIIAARVIPWRSVIEILLSLTISQVIGLVLVNLGIILLFCARWWIILRASGYTIPYLKLSGYRMAGFAISYFSPGTQFGGEPLQAYLVGSRHAVPAGTSIAAVTLDKALELFTNLSFLALGIILVVSHGLLPGFNRLEVAYGIAAIILIPLIYIAILFCDRLPLAWIAVHLPDQIKQRRLIQKILPLIEATERQMAGLLRDRPWLIIGTLLISILVWLLLLFEYWLAAYFLGARLSLLQAIGGYTAMRVSLLTPVPGAVGFMEGSQVLAFTSYGYSAALGISLSLLIRTRDFTVGLFGLWIGGLVGVNRRQNFPKNVPGLTSNLAEPQAIQIFDD